MIHISLEAVNLRSPYKVEQEDENIFSFVTKHGISYSVGFVADVSFFDEGVYQFFLINESGSSSLADKGVFETIRVIIEEFFAQKEPVMLYICDTTDMRQEYRDRLFRIWFETYEKNDLFSLHSEGMTIDNVRYFSSILLRKDHPMYIKVISAFHDFIKIHNQG